MNKLQGTKRLTKVSTHVMLAVLFTGCSTNTAQHLSSSSMKMAHHTTILDHQTHRSVDAIGQKSSAVNFEYEEIITQ